MDYEILKVATGALQAAVICISAVLATYTYWKRQRVERAQWVQELSRQFYDDDAIRRIMLMIHHDYNKLASLLDRRRNNVREKLSDDESKTMEDIDRFLNFLDRLIYLRKSRVILEVDIQSNFRHWLNVIGGGRFPELTEYSKRFGFVQIKELVNEGQFIPVGNPVTGL